MATQKTREEIQAMIQKLEASKNDVPEYSIFGDNNWRKTDELIEVLNGRFLDADEVYENEDDLEDASLCVMMLDWVDGEVDDEEFI